MGKNNEQYFMYGVMVSYQSYLDMKTLYVVDDVFKCDEGIQGIFTGRGGDFMIIGQVLKTIEANDREAHVVPELNEANMSIIRGLVKKKYGYEGEFHYYFIKK